MNLKQHYEDLYQESRSKIKDDHYQIDHLIDSKKDKRSGITLLIRPDEFIKDNIQNFLNNLREIDPTQYYYPNSDIHITVMSIISCYEGFKLSNISIEDYADVIKNSISDLPPFDIQFKGITASPSCIMIRGFTNNRTLNKLRDNLRRNFKETNLEQTIDKRYSIQTSHSTVVRFKKELTRKNDYLKVIEKHKNFDFGTFSVDSLEMVCNDWYHRVEKVKKLSKFEMKYK